MCWLDECLKSTKMRRQKNGTEERAKMKRREDRKEMVNKIRENGRKEKRIEKENMKETKE